MISVFFSLAAVKKPSPGNSPMVPVHGLRVGVNERNQEEQTRRTAVQKR